MRNPIALISTALLLAAQPVAAQISPGIPTQTQEVEGVKIPVPDFNNLTLDQLPALGTDGSYVVEDSALSQQLGYNVSRAWDPDSKVTEVMTLGDISNVLGKDISLVDLAPYTGGSVDQVKLSDIGPVAGASLQDLVLAHPELANMRLDQIPLFNEGEASPDRLTELLGEREAQAIRAFAAKHPLLEDLPLRAISKGKWDGILEGGAQIALNELSKKHPVLGDIRIKDLKSAGGLARTGLRIYDRVANGGTVAELIQSEPTLSEVPLGVLFDLENQGVDAIPGLANVALNKIPGGSQAAIERVPGLKNVPLKNLTGSTFANLRLAQFDISHSGDGIAPQALSGGTPKEVFRSEPCSSQEHSGCANIEVVQIPGIPGTHGKQWVQGDKQKVKGCLNSLCAVATEEPTGIKFDPSQNWKAVLVKADEGGDGEGATALLGVSFQLRYTDISGTLHTSAHFMGPIPIWSAPVKSPIPVAASFQDTIAEFGGQGGPQATPVSFSTTAANPQSSAPTQEEQPAPAPQEEQPLRPLQNPSPGAAIDNVLNFFGAERVYRPGDHEGIDLFKGKGSPILAIESGTVIRRRLDSSCNWDVMINHEGRGVNARYLHLSSADDITDEQKVERGQVIGREGAPITGCGTGSHLHFEMWPHGRGSAVNPIFFEYDPPLPTVTLDGNTVE